MIADLERDIPSNWLTTSTRFLFHVLNGSTPASNEASFWNGDIFWATPEDIGSLQGKVLNDTRRKITKDGYENSGAQIAPVGSILLTTRAPVGNLALTGIPLCTNQGCRLLVPKSDHVDTNFFYYQLQARRSELESYAAGTTFQELSATQLKAFQLWLPPLAEQQTIGKYLDHETSKIDTLIAELDDLLKLVAEKRQATISHAVTRGINPGVPLVDSGVDWIGEIPEHWDVISLKYLSESIQTGPFGSQLHAEEYVDNGIPVINPSHIRDGRIIPDPFITVDQETWSRLSRHHLQDGDIVFARRGEMGRCGLVEPHQEGWICGTGSIRVRLWKSLANPKYINIVLSLRGIKELLELESVGSTLDNLNTEIVGSIYLPVPPVAEQLEIVKYLDYEATRLNELATAIQETIELLQERRSALIAAAVTGKIRVTE